MEQATAGEGWVVGIAHGRIYIFLERVQKSHRCVFYK